MSISVGFDDGRCSSVSESSTAGPTLTASPTHESSDDDGVHHPQTITFVRHGHSSINTEGANRDVFDPPLTSMGRQQARRLAPCFEEPAVTPQLVLASPLSRAMETATIAFGCLLDFDTGDVVPLQATEHAREVVRRGEPAESRRSVAELSALFPSTDFSKMYEGEDPIQDEDRAAFSARATRLVQVARAAPCDSIAIVSHYHLILEAVSVMATSYGVRANSGTVVEWCGKPVDKAVVVEAVAQHLASNGAAIVANVRFAGLSLTPLQQ
jgi:broad specificity phosphatase PhoE